MTKEQVYKIQNKLINDVSGDVWISTNNDNDKYIKALAYINGVLEMTDEIIEILDTVKNDTVEE